jgi:non-ribosomal peptide synthetase component F/acyl carrier protein
MLERSIPVIASFAGDHRDAVALVAEDRSVTFRELSERVSEVAEVITKTVSPRHAVMVVVTRSIEYLCVVYACLESKRAFIPVARSDVSDKLLRAKPELLIEDVNAFVALRGRGGSRRVAEPFCYPLSTAYVIFTSGSSGTPKAVVASDRAIYAMARDQARIIGCTIGSRILQFAQLIFDGSISEILWPLVSGATLVVESQEMLMPGQILADTLIRQQITHLKTTPAALALTAPDSKMVLKSVINGGGQCRPELVRKWSPYAAVHNAYGLTETSICNFMTRPLSPDDIGGAVPIGAPIGGTMYSIEMDSTDSAKGQLVIGGSVVALGYLANGEIDSFAGDSGCPAFATGDVVEIRDGLLYVIGRNDRQAKVRGYRIDLNEVENAICALQGVSECVTYVETGSNGVEKLECVVSGAAVTVPQIRAHLSSVLERYKHPTTIYLVERISYTPLGKVDIQTAPATISFQSDNAKAGPAMLRDTVLAVARSVLHNDELSLSDSILDQGIDSVAIVEFIARLQNDSGIECSVVSVLQARSVAELADSCLLI